MDCVQTQKKITALLHFPSNVRFMHNRYDECMLSLMFVIDKVSFSEFNTLLIILFLFFTYYSS